jgi:hypothetical protein
VSTLKNDWVTDTFLTLIPTLGTGRPVNEQDVSTARRSTASSSSSPFAVVAAE